MSAQTHMSQAITWNKFVCETASSDDSCKQSRSFWSSTEPFLRRKTDWSMSTNSSFTLCSTSIWSNCCQKVDSILLLRSIWRKKCPHRCISTSTEESTACVCIFICCEVLKQKRSWRPAPQLGPLRRSAAAYLAARSVHDIDELWSEKLSAPLSVVRKIVSSPLCELWDCVDNMWNMYIDVKLACTLGKCPPSKFEQHFAAPHVLWSTFCSINSVRINYIQLI